MNSTRFRLFALAAFIIALSVGLDQWTKDYIMQEFVMTNRDTQEITPFFNLTVVWNRGISFGIFAKHDQQLALIGMSSVIVLILLGWLWQNTEKFVACALACVIGGALGNIIDRGRLGAVLDFLDFHVAGYHWPSFNIADSCIFIGVVLLCIHSMFMSPSHSTKDK